MAERKILVVDDEPLLVRGLERCLRGQGFDVTSVTSAEAALETVRGTFYDLCFLDLRLPGMDGIAAMDRLRAISPRTRIAVMTASHLTAAEREHVDAGSDYFFSKPFDVAEVKDLVAKLRTGW